MKSFYNVVMGLSLLFLAGCSYFDTGLEKSMSCPTIRVLEHSDKIVRFDGQQTLDNVLFEGKIESVTGECRWVDNTLWVELTIEGYLTMGLKADPKADYKSPFYVTITDLNKTIIQRLTTDVENKWNGRVGSVGATVDLEIPIKELNYADDLILYVGYNVTPDELAFIRTNSK